MPTAISINSEVLAKTSSSEAGLYVYSYGRELYTCSDAVLSAWGWSPQFACGSGEGAVAYLVNAPILLARSGLSENHRGGKTCGLTVRMKS